MKRDKSDTAQVSYDIDLFGTLGIWVDDKLVATVKPCREVEAPRLVDEVLVELGYKCFCEGENEKISIQASAHS